MPSVVYVPIVILISTFWLYILTSNAPLLNDESVSRLHFPSSLEDLRELAATMKRYREEHYVYVLIVFVSAYLYKQSFAIPGSVFLNILSGAVFGLIGGFTLVCCLNTIGASFCYFLSDTFCKAQIHHYFSHRLTILQDTIESNRSNLFAYLLFARLFPMTPNWFLNISSPIFNIPLSWFALSVFLGLMPYNFICVQTGVVLSEIKSLDDVFTYGVALKLLLTALIALVPSLLIKRTKWFKTNVNKQLNRK